MNNELFTYIGIPLNELNKEIKIQDQRVVLLFSYIYNECINTTNKIDNYENRIEKINNILTDVNEHISKIEFRLGKVDKKVNNIINVLKINNKDIDKDIEIDNENTKLTFKSRLKKIWNWIKYYILLVWNSIYKILFKKKIKKEIEEQEKKKLEEENRKIIEQKEQIKKILRH